MITTNKLLYSTSSEDLNVILKLMTNQNNVIRFMYNRIKDDPDITQKQMTRLVNSMNNITVDSWFKQSAIYKVQELASKDETVIFGGKKLFIQRCQKKISREEFEKEKLLPIYLVGESSKSGNRKLELDVIENNRIIFKPEFGIKIELKLPKLRKNFRRQLFRLQELMEQSKVAVTFQIDLENIYLTYNLKEKVEIDHIKNRIMSIDSNPNYLGYSIIDWNDKDTFKIVKTGCVSIKKLNDEHFKVKKSSNNPLNKYYVNKRSNEIYEISKRLVEIARYYRVESFGTEELNMKSSDRKLGNKYNRLVNNVWNRGKFFSNLEKRLNLYGIKLYKVFAQYSSFIGNFLNRKYYDPIAASIEINRRTYCFSNKIKPVVFPDFKKSIEIIKLSLEEMVGDHELIDGVEDWKSFYKQVKNSELRYRVPLDVNSKSLDWFNKKSLIEEIQT